MRLEVCELETKICVGFIEQPDDPPPAIRVEGLDFQVSKMSTTVRMEPGKFAHFTVFAIFLPVHLLAAMIASSAFIPRGRVEFIENKNDPELKLSDTKH